HGGGVTGLCVDPTAGFGTTGTTSTRACRGTRAGLPRPRLSTSHLGCANTDRWLPLPHMAAICGGMSGNSQRHPPPAGGETSLGSVYYVRNPPKPWRLRGLVAGLAQLLLLWEGVQRVVAPRRARAAPGRCLRWALCPRRGVR